VNTAELGRTTKKIMHADLTVTLESGAPAIPSGGVDVVLVPQRTRPTTTSPWRPADAYDGSTGETRFTVAGPNADPTDAHVVPAAGADVWVRVRDFPEVDEALLLRLVVR
jgi:hypothetical protein